jgi:multidrug efflux system membrane fusion protein
LGVTAIVALAVAITFIRGPWKPDGAVAQATRTPRAIPVEVVNAAKKKMPVLIEALGNVTTMASVAIKTRIDTQIIGVHFADGARVKQGDVLFTLDGSALEAQIKQVQGNIARDQAQLEGAERDVRRYTDLVGKNATPVINLDNAKTQADTFRAAMKADQAALENLQVQLGWCTIRAPISGRISSASVKVGNFVRQADVVPLATINQISPIYVSFPVPQRRLPDIRRALAAETATVEAVIPGEDRHATGQVTVIENTVDPATGTVLVRATMPNTDELLWPGTLVSVHMTLREEEAVTVPSVAIQTGQSGNFVFVVTNGTANVRAVKVERTVGSETVIESGLAAGETVVTNGHLLLTNGSRVAPREAKTGA